MTKYGLFARGKMIRLVKSLQQAMTSRAYEPWNGTEIYEFKYNHLGLPISVEKVS